MIAKEMIFFNGFGELIKCLLSSFSFLKLKLALSSRIFCWVISCGERKVIDRDRLEECLSLESQDEAEEVNEDVEGRSGRRTQVLTPQAFFGEPPPPREGDEEVVRSLFSCLF